MDSRPAPAVRAAPDVENNWLWSSGGRCVGYRRGDSLFTSEGIEIGQFSGKELYGVDGRYLGELSAAADGSRLVANVYKKSCSRSGFDPGKGPSYKPPADRTSEQLCCGHEDFSIPEMERAPRRGSLRSRTAAP